LPENLKFWLHLWTLSPTRKNFVVSYQTAVAQISQIYYEKNSDALKIHLTLESGNIKKDNIAFYFAEANQTLLCTVGIKDYQKRIVRKLNSFGFLLDSPILEYRHFNGLSAGKQKILVKLTCWGATH